MEDRLAAIHDLRNKYYDNPKLVDDHIAIATGMFMAYVEMWGDPFDTFNVVAIEREFKLPLLHPETGEESFINYTGLIDKVVVEIASGLHFVMDHKTVGQKLGDGTSRFWQQWLTSPQASIYALAAKQENFQYHGFLVDATYKSRVTRPDSMSVDDYETKVRDNLLKTPEDCFVRHPVYRSDSQLLMQLKDMSAVATRIYSLLNKDDGDYWIRNRNACFDYGRTCPYYEICACQADADGSMYVKKEGEKRNPKELVISHSSIAKFTSCEKQYYYNYVHGNRGIEKVDRVDRAALDIGTMFHSYLDILFGDLNESEGSDQNVGTKASS